MFLQLRQLLHLILENARAMLPIVLVIGAFQLLVIGQPLMTWLETLRGALFVLLGLTFFVQGMAMSLFPLGESLAESLLRRANLALLLFFAFAIGFGSTVAEPALIAVTREASAVAFAAQGDAVVARNALILRGACALAVGLAVMAGCIRILKGWAPAWLVLGGYGLAMLSALVSQSPLTAIALDAGAAATSAINIPLISALGIGMATMLKAREPLADGFGMVALCSVMPVLAIMFVAQFLT